jgi:hypothetical protein
MSAKVRWTLIVMAIVVLGVLLTMFAISKLREATFYPG